MNGRPLGMRKKIQLLIALTILAWATQTLLHQWGFGAEVPAEAGEKFVPGSARFAAGATLELRSELTVHGREVRLRQICKWGKADEQLFAQVADLVLARLEEKAPFRAITLDEIKTTLHDAGVNLAVVRFAGPTSCTVSRSDVEFDEQTALEQWIEAKTGDAKKAPAKANAGVPVEAEAPAARTAPVVHAKSKGPEASPIRTLRSLLTSDLAVRLGLDEDELQISFNPKDEKVLNLAEPLFKFNLEPRSVRNLGEVSWNVLILTGGASQKAMIAATARAWQKQVVLNRPLTFHQVIRPTDFVEKRILSDRLPDEQLLTPSQVAGQQAARDLKPGTIVTARMVEAVPLVKPGQLVTVTLTMGNIQVKTVGKALVGGAYGQTVKVKNEATREVLEVMMTGPQEGTVTPGPVPASARVGSDGAQ